MTTGSSLRERIRASSLDEVVLEEMIRHGFWEADTARSAMPADFIKRKGELLRELREIVARERSMSDPEQALKAVMAERMRVARLQRVVSRREAAVARNERAAAFDARRRTRILSLGDVHSAPLANTESKAGELRVRGLPVFGSPEQIAQEMGLSVGELRFLTFDRRVARYSHYVSFEIPKKTGGTRQISAPMPRLKRAQYWVLDNILEHLEPHEAAHGFRKGRSIITNAMPHVGQDLVINMDLRDFFPSITYPRVKGLFVKMGYSEAEAAIFALLCTEAPREKIEIDGTTWHVAQGPRRAPQGAPTSPAIANLITRLLDRRLSGLASSFGLTYTRYADDLTFSGPRPEGKRTGAFLHAVRDIVAEEGFEVHPDKTRLMRRGSRQEVTGLVVNDKVAVSREERRRFRAWLHNAQKGGQPLRPFRPGGDPVESGRGFASYLHMVGGPEAHRLAERAWAQLGPATESAAHEKAFRAASAQGNAPGEDWWQPAERAPFVPEPLPEMPSRDIPERQTDVPRVSREAPAERQRPWGQPGERQQQPGSRQSTATQGENRYFLENILRFIPMLALSFVALAVMRFALIGLPVGLWLLYMIWKPKLKQKGFAGGVEMVIKLIGISIGVSFALVVFAALFASF